MTRVGPRSPLRSLVAHPILTAVLAILGILAGIAAARSIPLTYTTEARLAVVSATNDAYSIPGYPLAARELAADYSRWVQNNATGGAWAPPGSVSVSASPIPDSAVIRVEVGARSQEQATQGAQQVSATLLKTVAGAQAQHDPQRAFRDFSRQAPGVALARAQLQQAETTYNRAIGAGASASRIRAAGSVVQKARVKLAELELKQNAAASLYQRLYSDTQGASTLKQIVPAAPVGTPERTAQMRFGVLGAAAGLFCALLLAVALDRRRDRRRGGEPVSSIAPADSQHSTGAMVTAPTAAAGPGPGPRPDAKAPRSHLREHAPDRRAEADTR